MLIAMVVGNGESRSNIDLEKFTNDYDIIGCNALHRDLKIHHLVCCDRRMVEEAVAPKSRNTLETKIYVRPEWFKYFRKIRKDKRIHQVPDLPYTGESKVDKPINWGSGTYAVLLGAQLYNTVILLGFDLYSVNEKVNNIYKGTKHYAKKDSKPVDHSFWVYQISKVFEYYPDTEFIVMNKKDWEMPKSWTRSNVRFEEII